MHKERRFSGLLLLLLLTAVRLRHCEGICFMAAAARLLLTTVCLKPC